jgi:hypothetical protein
MRENGFTEAELDLMFKANPACLLGLPINLLRGKSRGEG